MRKLHWWSGGKSICPSLQYGGGGGGGYWGGEEKRRQRWRILGKTVSSNYVENTKNILLLLWISYCACVCVWCVFFLKCVSRCISVCQYICVYMCVLYMLVCIFCKMCVNPVSTQCEPGDLCPTQQRLCSNVRSTNPAAPSKRWVSLQCVLVCACMCLCVLESLGGQWGGVQACPSAISHHVISR